MVPSPRFEMHPDPSTPPIVRRMNIHPGRGSLLWQATPDDRYQTILLKNFALDQLSERHRNTILLGQHSENDVYQRRAPKTLVQIGGAVFWQAEFLRKFFLARAFTTK